MKVQRKRNCETHRKTEEPCVERPSDQEHRKNKITKARLKYQQRLSGSSREDMLHSVSTELTKEDSNAQKLQRDRGFWLLSLLVTVPPPNITLILKWRQ